MTTSAITRKLLLDELILKGDITGRLDLMSFLKRFCDTDNMKSTDRRFTNATGDIWQHMVNNDDWDDMYLYNTYLDVTNDQALFFRFLEQVVHPLVRAESDAEEYVSLINSHLIRDSYALKIDGYVSGYPMYRVMSSEGIAKEIKNLIFAADGPKPEIVLDDALSNTIKIVKNEEYCLVYDAPIPPEGLFWSDLVTWWNNKVNSAEPPARSLYQRLFQSLDSPPEQILFYRYYSVFSSKLKERLPALIPQVYLHYDPYTLKALFGDKRIPRQRMDFLILLPTNKRVVIEVDGQQHYSVNSQASPSLYAEMVSADRKLKLAGYEVYRFGGYEFQDKHLTNTAIDSFFDELFVRHGIVRNANEYLS